MYHSVLLTTSQFNKSILQTIIMNGSAGQTSFPSCKIESSIRSQSYPPQLIHLSSKQHSQVHKLIRENPHIAQVPIVYRDVTRQDLPQLSKLCRQFFPQDYPQQVYDQYTITIKGKVATVSGLIGDAEKQLIVGIIAWKIGQVNQYFQKQNINNENEKPIQLYIMTLGVIDEFRRRGIAQKLMQIVTKVSDQDNSIKYLSLNVLTTNTPALNFYEKMGFKIVKMGMNCFETNGSFFHSFYHMKFVNGGKKSELPWWKEQEEIKDNGKGNDSV